MFQMSPKNARRMHHVLWIAACFAIASTAIAGESTQIGTNAALTKTTETLLSLLSKGKFAQASELFHYPSDYTDAERAKDQDAVKFSLLVLDRNLGRPLSAESLRGTADFISVSTGGGTLPYWEKHPESIVVQLRVTYAVAGPGFLVLRFVAADSKLELRSLEYGLPRNDHSVQLLRGVTEELMQRMRAEQ